MQALAGRPDGLGFPTEQTTHYHLQQLEGRQLAIEPHDTSSSAAIQSAGVTALLAASGLGIGLAAGGVFGMGAGLLLAGTAANAYRAQKWLDSQNPSEKHEAVVSLTFAIFEGVAGVYLGYRAYREKSEKKGRAA